MKNINSMTIGERNNNPLNIRRTKTPWRGEKLPIKGAGGAFCQFETMEWGIRAAFCLLRTYARKYRAVCIHDIIMRWAPPSENDTERYIRNVCLWTGFGGMQRLTEREWPLLVRAMARQECGIQLDDATIARGFSLYKLI